jgi:hypothetical protein
LGFLATELELVVLVCIRDGGVLVLFLLLLLLMRLLELLYDPKAPKTLFVWRASLHRQLMLTQASRKDIMLWQAEV